MRSDFFINIVSLFAPLLDIWSSTSAALYFCVRSLNIVPSKNVHFLLILLNSYKLWWDFRKPFPNLTAMAWEFLPRTTRLANPWPRIIVVAKHGAGWLCELCVYKKFLTFLSYSWHSFLWERLVIPLKAKSFSSASSSDAATIWLLVKNFSGCVKDKLLVLSFLHYRSISVLSRWQKQANSKFLVSAWQQWPSVVLGSKRPFSPGHLSPTSLSKQIVPEPQTICTPDPGTSCRPWKTNCSLSQERVPYSSSH